MKEVLSLFTFGIWALFFVVFFTALKPNVVLQLLGRASPAIAARKLHRPSPAARSSLPQRCGLTSGSGSDRCSQDCSLLAGRTYARPFIQIAKRCKPKLNRDVHRQNSRPIS